MTELVLQGPFLTRAQAARLSGIPAELLPDRPDLLHVRSRFSQEAYFSFQFDEHGIRPEIATVVRAMRTHADELTVAGWLAKPNSGLHGSSPLNYLNGSGSVERVIALIDVPETVSPSIEPHRVVPGPAPSRRAARYPRQRRLGFTH